MKRIIVLLIVSFLCFPTLVLATNSESSELMLEEAMTQKKKSKYTFKDLEKLEGVDVVFVSKMMLSLAKGFIPTDVGAGGVDVKGLMKDLTGVHIISIENPASVKKALVMLSDLLDSDYEVIMTMKESGSDDLTFYYKESKNKDDSELVMVTNEGGKELSIIRLKGKIDFEKLQKLTN